MRLYGVLFAMLAFASAAQAQWTVQTLDMVSHEQKTFVFSTSEEEISTPQLSSWKCRIGAVKQSRKGAVTWETRGLWCESGFSSVAIFSAAAVSLDSASGGDRQSMQILEKAHGRTPAAGVSISLVWQ